MSRGPRGPKRSPTPTSATTPTSESGPIPPSPGGNTPQKPLYLCSPFVEAALVKGSFKTIVMLPKYVDIMEWVAVNSTPKSCLFLFLTPNDCTVSSLRFLHKPERILRCHHRMLYPTIVSDHVRGAHVRSSLVYYLLILQLKLTFPLLSKTKLYLDQPRSEER